MSHAKATRSVHAALPPHATTLPRWVDPELLPLAHHFVEVDGHRIHYLDEGAGPVLLFVHAAPTWSFYYREMVLGLRDRFRCVALDLPGWGLSDAAPGFQHSLPAHSTVVEHFIQRLALTDVTLAVHDSGGPIALGVAVRKPEWFRAFVLTSTLGWPLAEFPRVRLMLNIVSSWPFRLLNACVNLLPHLVARFAPRQRSLSPAERRALTGAFHTWARRDRILRMLGELVRQSSYLADLERGLRAKLADRPALILFGEVDPVRKLGFDKRWQAIFPRHRALTIPREQHFAHLGAAREMIAHMLSFWDDLVKPLDSRPIAGAAP
jgi:haloalkane dehalogenase